MRITQTTMNQAPVSVDAQKHAKLVDAAQQFEAMMMQELLKPFATSPDGWGGEQQDGDAAADTMNSFGTEAVAKAIAKSGGLGIAKQIIQQVTLEGQETAARKP